MINMYSRLYSQQDIGKLLSEFNLGTPISEIEVKLNRTAVGIVKKIIKLSKVDPHVWNQNMVERYKRDLLRQHNEEYRGYYRQRVLEHLIKHPTATVADVRKAGLSWHLRLGYGNRLNDARKDANIDVKLLYAERLKKVEERHNEIEKRRKEKVITFFKKHPKTTKPYIIKAGLGRDFNFAYNGAINRARKDAGILTDEYVSAAETARQLDVSKERVSQLFEGKKLNGYRLGRLVYISLESIESRKQLMSQNH